MNPINTSIDAEYRAAKEFPQQWVTAIVPVRNRRDTTLRFLANFALQTYPWIRVICVDSSSDDGTTTAIKSLFPDVKLVQATDRHFWAGATNLGVIKALKSDSQWILTINDDSVVPIDYVEKLLFLAQKNNCKILGGMILYMHNSNLIWSLGTYTAWGTSNFLRLGLHGQTTSCLQVNCSNANIIPADALPGNGVIIHKDVFRRIGLYNQYMLPHYHADSEFTMRAISKGVQAYVTPNIALLNDFCLEQKKLPLQSGFQGIVWTFSNPKSYLYIPALFYIFFRYCPLRLKVPTFAALVSRFFTTFT